MNRIAISRIAKSHILALTAAAAFAAMSLFAPAAQAAEVRGAGSTFAYPIIWKWAQAFRDRTGHLVGYQSVGS